MTQHKQPGERQKEPKRPDRPAARSNQAQPNTNQSYEIPKPESSSEYEGAPSRKPTGNPPEAVKTESSSEYEGAPERKPAGNPPNAVKTETSSTSGE